MKKIIVEILIALTLLIAGCDLYVVDDPHYHDGYYDDGCYYAPYAPTNVHSVTGDNSVYIYWNPVSSWDLEGYDVYRGYGPTGYYDYIGSTSCASFITTR